MFLYWDTPIADITGDGLTDAADAAYLFAEWSGDAAPVSVPEPPRPEVRKPLFSPKPVEPVRPQFQAPEESDDELDIPAFIRKKMK
jgi:hypothetical protein